MIVPEHACTLRDHHAKLGATAADLYAVIAQVPVHHRHRLLISILSDLRHHADKEGFNWGMLLDCVHREYNEDAKKDADFRAGAYKTRTEG